MTLTEQQQQSAPASTPSSGGLRQAIKRTPESVRATVPLVIAIVALSAFTASRSDFFLTGSNIENIFQQITVLGILAIGMTFLMVAGYMDLSVGALASCLTVVCAKMAEAEQSQFAMVVVAILLGILAGMLIGCIVAAVRVAPFILTLGFLSVFSSIGLVLSNGRPIPVTSGAFSNLGLGQWFGLPAAGIVLVACLIVASLALRYTRIGRNAYAIGSSPRASFLAGVPTGRLTIVLFGISGLCVGIASIVLIGRIGAGDPGGAVGLELQAIAAVVLGGASLSGGRGTVIGTFLGVLLLGLIANSLNLLGVQIFYQELVYGMVLIVAVVATAIREGRELPLRVALQTFRRRISARPELDEE